MRSVVRIYPGPLNLRDFEGLIPANCSRQSGLRTGPAAVFESLLEPVLIGSLVDHTLDASATQGNRKRSGLLSCPRRAANLLSMIALL